MLPRPTLIRAVGLIGLLTVFVTSLWPVAAAPARQPQTPPAPATAAPAPLAPSADKAVTASTTPSPLAFEPNVGQFPPATRFQVQALGGAIAFTAQSLMFTLPSQASAPTTSLAPLPGQAAGRNPFDRRIAAQPTQTALPPAVLQQHFLDTTPTAPTGADQLPGTVGYFQGDDPAGWYTDIPTYGSLMYDALYPGIALAYHGQDSRLKSVFTVAPGADPTRIRWRYDEASAVQIDAMSGDLLVTIPPTAPGGMATTLREAAPLAWQDVDGQRLLVAVRFVLASDASVGFTLGAHDPAFPLVIDPTLSYSLFEAAGPYSGTDDVTVDGAGNVYTVSTLDTAVFGDSRIIVKKTSPAGAELDRGYLAGSDFDFGVSIAVDAQGRVYVGGWTSSPDFPRWPEDGTGQESRLRTALSDETHDRCYTDYTSSFCSDAFVTRLTPALTLAGPESYSVTFGGRTSDSVYALAVDGAGNVYATGQTASLDFPTQVAAQGTCDMTNEFCSDGFVLRINAAGTLIDYSSYLGGAWYDSGNGVAVTTSGEVYVTGVVNTGDQSEYGDGDSAFLAKFAGDGTQQYRLLLGGPGEDGASSVTVADPTESQSAVYLTGWTTSGAIAASNASVGLDAHHGGLYDAFLMQLSPQGSIQRTSLIGGDDWDAGADVAVNANGKVFVTGATSSGTSFPAVQAPDDTAGTGTNAFLIMLTADQTNIGLSMQLGGSAGLFGNGSSASAVAVDRDGNAYVVGTTYSSNFAGGPANEDSGVLSRGFLSKVNGLPPAAPRETISYYVQRNNLEAMRLLGCESRQYREQGMVVLAFGRPRNAGTDANPSYVVGLIGADPPVLVPLSTAEELVLAFAEGYVNWSGCVAGAPVPSPGLPNLALAVGTNNSKNASAQTNPDLNRASGIAWAAMVNRLNDEVEQRGWFPAVRVLGGLDAEFGNDPLFGVDPTAWIEGYGQTTVFPFVTYNACNGCPIDQPRATWNEPELEKVYRASIAPALAYPLPQVYFTLQAKQWFNARRYAFERFGDRKPFAGPMVSCRATGDCNFADRTNWQLAQPDQFLSPPQSWQALYDTLNDATTPDGSTNEVQQVALPFVTDLVYQTAPANFRRTPRS